MHTLDSLLHEAAKAHASDLHLGSGRRPVIRHRNQALGVMFKGSSTLSVEEARTIILSALSKDQLEKFESDGGADLAKEVALEGGSQRYRLSIFKEEMGLSLVGRRINSVIKNLSQLGMPKQVAKYCHKDTRPQSGLVLLAGATGSGKSTTIASMLNEINLNEAVHILTLEEPIEYIFKEEMATIRQREIGLHVKDWSMALRQAMRQDPDVMLIGEMRDYETFKAAINAARTGHLVFGTIHSDRAGQAPARILDLFPEGQREGVRIALAQNLKAVIAQKLVTGFNEQRLPACELMEVTPAIKAYLERGELTKIEQQVEASQDGMFNFADSLHTLVKEKKISSDVAMEAAPNPEAFRMRLKGIKLNVSSL